MQIVHKMYTHIKSSIMVLDKTSPLCLELNGTVKNK